MNNHSKNIANKPLIIFGIGKIAQVLVEYLASSDLVVSAFCVENELTASD
ncbi:MAG: hypothetical protein ACJAXH_000171 [Colwellia sp.]|jgi:hypothetical protein